jgi:hypothetical protein
MIAFSGLFLGINLPLDLIVSFLVAIPVILINKRLVPWSHKSERNRYIFLGGYAAFFIVCTVVTLVTGGSMADLDFPGLSLGLVIGLFVEERYIHYEVRERSRKEKIFLALVGIVIIALCLGVPLTLIGSNGGLVVGGFLGIIATTVICPYLFKRYDEGKSAAPVEAAPVES